MIPSSLELLASLPVDDGRWGDTSAPFQLRDAETVLAPGARRSPSSAGHAVAGSPPTARASSWPRFQGRACRGDVVPRGVRRSAGGLDSRQHPVIRQESAGSQSTACASRLGRVLFLNGGEVHSSLARFSRRMRRRATACARTCWSATNSRSGPTAQRQRSLGRRASAQCQKFRAAA